MKVEFESVLICISNWFWYLITVFLKVWCKDNQLRSGKWWCLVAHGLVCSKVLRVRLREAQIDGVTPPILAICIKSQFDFDDWKHQTLTRGGS
jgi:hypothetical protein